MTRGRPMIEIDADELAAMRKKGMRVSEIAESFGLSRSTIRKRLIQAGMHYNDAHGPRPKCAPLDLAQIRRMYEGGMTLQRIADRFGVHVSAAHAWVRRSGSTFANKRGQKAKEIRNQEVVRQRAAGMTLTEIAEHHAISRTRVTNILHREAGR